MSYCDKNQIDVLISIFSLIHTILSSQNSLLSILVQGRDDSGKRLIQILMGFLHQMQDQVVLEEVISLLQKICSASSEGKNMILQN